MGLVLRRRGQISLEFLFVFTILMIMLLYSAKYVTFSSSTSSQTLAVQTVIEEKSIANVIGGAIDQVYAQGPGAKVTVYVHFSLLRNEEYLKRAFGYDKPVVEMSLLGANDSLLPAGSSGGVILVGVRETSSNPVVSGNDKSAAEVRTLYSYAGNTIKVEFFSENNPGTPKISDIPSTMRVVVEWNPEKTTTMAFNVTSGTLYININPGG